jgi:hypothetical protein
MVVNYVINLNQYLFITYYIQLAHNNTMSDINIEDYISNVVRNNTIPDINIEDSINVVVHNNNIRVINIEDSTEDNVRPVLLVNDTVTALTHTPVASPLGTHTTRSSVCNAVPVVAVVTTENTANNKDKQSFPKKLITFSFENWKSLVCTDEPDPCAPNNSVEVAQKIIFKDDNGVETFNFVIDNLLATDLRRLANQFGLQNLGLQTKFEICVAMAAKKYWWWIQHEYYCSKLQ